MNAGESVTIRVAGALDNCGLPYMLAGSFSSNYYGVPRSTKDADFVVQLKGAVGNEFEQQMGNDFSLDPQLSFETNTGTFRQILHYRRSAFKVELFMLSKDEHDQARFQRRQFVALFDRKIWLPSVEDVIIVKLRWARSKDEDDVGGVIAVQGDKLDWPYIESWCDRHGTRKSLEEIRRSLPKI